MVSIAALSCIIFDTRIIDNSRIWIHPVISMTYLAVVSYRFQIRMNSVSPSLKSGSTACMIVINQGCVC